MIENSRLRELLPVGMNLNGPIYLQRNGFLTSEKNKILDIGPQNVLFVREEQIREFVANQGWHNFFGRGTRYRNQAASLFLNPAPRRTNAAVLGNHRSHQHRV